MEPEIRKAFQLYKYHQESAKFLAGEIYKFSQSLVKGDDSRPGVSQFHYNSNSKAFYSPSRKRQVLCLIITGLIKTLTVLQQVSKNASVDSSKMLFQFQANKNFYSETCLVTMGKMLGSFVALDNLICFNAAFRNDFAEYNRTLIKAKNAGVAPVKIYANSNTY